MQSSPITQNPHPQNENPNLIETEIAQVTIRRDIIETSSFQEVLLAIPQHVQRADELLHAYRTDKQNFLENIDEAALDAMVKELADVSSYCGKIDGATKNIKKHFDGIRDEALAELKTKLDHARYGELNRAQSDIRQLKQDMEADRRAKRWDELRPTFEANVNRYHLFRQYAPEFGDFSRFKLINPKMVSGAKTRHLKPDDHTKINNMLYEWNTGIEMMIQNEWGLSVEEQNQLLSMFRQNPSIELVQREGRQLRINADQRELARQQAEAKRMEQERQNKEAEEKRQREMDEILARQRIAQEQKNKEDQMRAEQERRELEERSRIAAMQEAERKAQYERDFQEFGAQYKPIFREAYPEFIQFLFNNPSFRDIHTNPVTKMRVIYQIARQVETNDTVVARETGLQAPRILKLIEYVMNL